jgi:putative sugar O-methyltransferase
MDNALAIDILKEAQQYRSDVLELYARTGYDRTYKLNQWWNRDNVSIMDDCLLNSADAATAIQKISRTHLYNIQRSGAVLAKAVEWQAQQLADCGLQLASVPPAMAESDLVPDEICATLEGRRVSNEFFRNLYLVDLCKRKLRCDGGASVFELGAGMGNLARLFLLGGVARTYTVIDIPHTLVFSFLFLRLSFPGLSYIFIRNQDDVTRSKAQHYDLVFCPTMFAEQIGTGGYDLFVNTASLGEMPNETIRYWMNYVQRAAEPKYLLSVNRYLNTNLNALEGVDAFRLQENECSVLYDHRWKVVHWNYDPHYGRCPYACMVARYLELLVERLPAGHAEAQIAHAEAKGIELLREVVGFEEWVGLFDNRKAQVGDTTMFHAFHIDTSMRGTLFKLWESIRLHPNLQNLMVMLSYLEMLRDDAAREFEEVSYYEGFLTHILAHYTGPAEDVKRLAEWIRWRAARRALIQRQHLENLRGEDSMRTIWDTTVRILAGVASP